MSDFASYSATMWAGALQAAATVAARHEPMLCLAYNPDRSAERVVDLAARILRQLPEFDQRIGQIAMARQPARRAARS